MNNATQQEILAKRQSNIDLLKSYINAGKTPDEKIVKKTIENIRRAETQLEDNGYTDFDKVNDDGSFTKSKENKVDTSVIEINNHVSSTKSEEKITNVVENSEPHKVSNTKKKLDKIEKMKTDKLGVSIKEKNLNNIHKLSKESGRTPNNIVNFMLESIYDSENNKFLIDFPKKENTKNTSYLLEERYAKAIDKIAKKTKLSKSDIFNTLLEKALEEYI